MHSFLLVSSPNIFFLTFLSYHFIYSIFILSLSYHKSISLSIAFASKRYTKTAYKLNQSIDNTENLGNLKLHFYTFFNR